jgi:hypothetical protein
MTNINAMNKFLTLFLRRILVEREESEEEQQEESDSGLAFHMRHSGD